MSDVILEAREIRKHFPVSRGGLVAPQRGVLKAVDGLSFSIAEGETLGLVGESGCGKSTTSKLILLLEALSDGAISFRGKDVTQFTADDRRAYRRAVQAVFQDPYSSLSPRMRIGDIVGEPVRVNTRVRGADLKGRVRKVLNDVGLSDPSVPANYPHEFSGGQRQRIAIARALALEPEMIVLDEPVSALDVSIRAQIMNLLKELQQSRGVAYLLIAHDLAVVRHMSNRIGVMYLGKLVEIADSDELSLHPLHPYTQALYSAALPSHPDIPTSEIILTGEVPSPLDPPSGCPFRTRCAHAMPVCAEVPPPLREAASGHCVACHLYTSSN